MNKPQSVILSFDISSSKTGFAVLRKGRWNKSKSSYGTIDVPQDYTLGQKLVWFRDAIEELLYKIKPTSIVIEDVFSSRNISTVKILARFNGVAIETCSRFLNKEPFLVLTTRVRSFLECGRSKEEAFNYIIKRYHLNWDFKKMNDVADALCLALYYYKARENS